MKTDLTSLRSRERGAGLVWLILAVLALVVGGVIVFQARGGGAEIDPSTIFEVKKERIRISVIESGQLKAAESVDVKSEIRGSTTILELIDEGEHVEPGDKLVVLDAASLEDDLTAQKIQFAQGESARIQAEKAVEIQESTNQSQIRKAQLALENANDELEKWLDGGQTLEQQKMVEDLTVAENEERIAQAELENTKELVDRNFAAQTELEADELSHKRSRVRVAQLQREQDLKDKFDWKIMERTLRADVAETTAELGRARSESEANMAKVRADLTSKMATYDLEKSKLDLLAEQKSKATIYATASGFVVYPSNSMGGRGGDDRNRIELGSTVRERQLIVSIPDTSKMIAAISVHESAIEKVKVGQPATVTIDAKQDTVYYGKVAYVAPLPDSQNAWLNPDLKVYRVDITLAGDTVELRPGMSISCEIVVTNLDDALSVPVHAVHREGSTLFCYVEDSGAAVIREIEVGLSNDSRVAITEGLAEGDRVYLTVPTNAPKPDFEDESEADALQSMEELEEATKGIDAGGVASDAAGRGMGRGGERGGPGGERRGPGGERGGPGGERGGSGGRTGGFDPAAMQRYQNASPEEKKRLAEEAMKNLSPEMRKRMEDARKAREGGGGDQS